ncbi:MAG: IS3 family transposase [Saprospiraceae bacterium]|nr:IS3 family transposase [Saprospiraceae bacterium]
MNNGVKRGLIEPQNKDISISRQCELIGINRSDYYYEPQGESAENLAIMAALDKLHTDYPTYGVKRMVVNLPEPFQPTNHKKIRRLMRLMGIEALYQKPNLSQKGKESVIYPYLLRKVPIEHRAPFTRL